jgi:hypothetical protein
MPPTFVVYLDEAGDEGFQFDRGSTEWFVLSAVIVRKREDAAIVRLVDDVRKQLDRPPRKPLHFRDLRHEHRLPFVDRIARERLGTVSLLVHKPSLREPEKFREEFRLYFYAARYVLERVSWYCRDHVTSRDMGDGSAEIVFSNRSDLSYPEMRTYLAYLKANTGLLDVRIEWRAISPERIVSYTPGKRAGLQVADAVATSFFKAVELSRLGFAEDRYARMLKPIVYGYKGRRLGYGVKFWPREVDEMLRREDRFGWIRDW